MGAGERNIYQGESRVGFYKPKGSTSMVSGDAIKLNPLTGRIEPLTKDEEGRDWFIGFSSDEWSADRASLLFGIGTTEYATPSNVRLKVTQKGRQRVGIVDTSGFAGQPVYLHTATSGGMLFTTARPSDPTAVVVGHVEADFSGASANDPHNIIMVDRRTNMEPAIYQYLNNHVVDGLPVAFDSSSLVSYGAGRVFVNGAFYNIAAATAALGLVCASHASKKRCVLYVVNSAGAAAIVDTGTNKFSGVGTLTALADSQYWPKTSYLIFGAGVVNSGSAVVTAARVRTVRRSVADVLTRRLISN